MSIHNTNNEPKKYWSGNRIEKYSRLLRLNTAKGSGTDLVTVGPDKVKACKSILFIEGIP